MKNKILKKIYLFILAFGYISVFVVLLSNNNLVYAQEDEDACAETIQLNEDYYCELNSNKKLQEELNDYVSFDSKGKIIFDIPDEVQKNYDKDIISGIKNNILFLNEAIEDGDVYINSDLEVCLSGTDDILDLQDGNNKFVWHWYGFEMWLDCETSIIVGLITALISKSISYATQADLITYVNKGIGYIDPNTTNPGKYLHQTALYKISILSSVIRGSIIGIAAFETLIQSTLPGLGSVIVAALKIAVKTAVMIYGNYVFGKALYMIGYGIVKGQSYTRFKFGSIKVSY